jgi:hypothetical protein
MRRLLPLCAFLAVAIAALAQRVMTADEVVAFIKSSLQLHLDDVKIAAYVKRIKLSDQLEDRRVEELQSMGAGAHTILALRAMSRTSASLPVAPPPPPVAAKPTIPPPPQAEIDRILHEVVDGARNYADNLPNYLCIQITRRHYDPTGTENWRLHDTIQEQLSYADHKENYKVVMINGQAVANMEHAKLGGSTLSGDFGSIYAEIFDPDTATEFTWDHWATLRGRRMYVFAFHVPQSRSHFPIAAGESHRAITAGYHGLIYADRATNNVMRYKFECEDIPADFPIHDVRLDVNFDFIDIAGQKYVLPLKTEVWSRDGRYMTWNEAEFHLYRKFGTESTITFDTPDPIPEDQTKEQPAEPDSKDPNTPVKKKQQ